MPHRNVWLWAIVIWLVLFAGVRSATAVRLSGDDLTGTIKSIPVHVAPDHSIETVVDFYAKGPHPIVCATSDADWYRIEAEHGLAWNAAAGFTHTFTANRTIYLSYFVCSHYRGGLRDPYFGLGLHVVIHEAYHWVYGGNEGTVECASLRVLQDAILRFWEAPPTSYLSRYAYNMAAQASKQRPAAYQDCSALQ